MHPMNVGQLVCTQIAFLLCLCLVRHEELSLYLSQQVLDLLGKDVCVLGRGITIGRTVGLLLSLHGYDATVINCHSRTQY